MSLYAGKGFTEGTGNPKPCGKAPHSLTNEKVVGPVPDKTKEWQMELLMEKLRSKSSQFKSIVECAKALRMALLEKRYPVDSVERNQLQKCLDTLQHSIKVTSLQGMVERLESVSRQLGLKFMSGQSGFDWFISSDMFYLEIVLEPSGVVKEVKIHHEGKVEQQSCEELVSCLSRGDFADFTAQLEGLVSIYQLNAEKKVKCKAFSALQSLETDLGALAQLQTFIKEPFNLVHKSPVGILERRRGGHAMKLTYLVPPYDLLDQKSKSCLPLCVEEVTAKGLGYSVTVCMEGSVAHKLQTSPLISVNRSPGGKSTPVYATMTASNSAVLPACFVLRLSKPLPMCLPLVRRIQQVTEIEWSNDLQPHPLMSLITQHASAGQLDCSANRGLFVSLPDQQHCYFMTESKDMDGVLVSSIPFTHPAHVPQILGFLRQQALFNVLISSCIRPSSKQDLENMIMFEITALSWHHLSISFEHPLEETMATAELDLTDIANVKCKVHGNGADIGTIPETATKILQRCLSIPVTMRSLVRAWQHRSMGGMSNGGAPPGSGGGGGGGGSHHGVPPDFDIGRVKTEPGVGQGGFGGPDTMGAGGPDPSFQPPNVESVGGPWAVLGGQSKSTPSALLGIMSDQQPTSGKKRKRKGGNDNWRSPKRRPQEDYEIVLESSSSDSTPLGTPNSIRDTFNDPSMDCEPDKPDSEFGDEDMFEFGDVEDMKPRKSKKDKKSSPPTIILDLPESKNLVPPSVSITPITTSSSNLNSVLTTMGLERRPGIEIIPIVSTPTSSIPSSITITPISSKSCDDRGRDRKSSKSRSEDKNRVEKKRKRKREESPGGLSMGPPDKLPPKQDPLSKPISVSIKPTEQPPLRPSSPLRKISSSPTHSTLPISKSSSSKSSSQHQSPKHSPGYNTSSPKHHGTSSPKHQSGGGSGKPSMQALKSAASSPGKESQKLKSSSSSKEKDRKVSGSSGQGSSPKLKSSSVKLKQLDLSSGVIPSETGSTSSMSGSTSSSKSLPAAAQRNRKGSLSAVIDKLTAQHCEQGTDSGRNANPTSGKPPGEYMVKSSSEGIKITINKTRTKESKPKSSGSGSPKTHTGLKPGVNSGPASKKPQKPSSGANAPGKPLSSNPSKNPLTKNSSVNLISKPISKSSGSPKMPDLSRRDKARPGKGSEKSVFGSKSSESRKSSPVGLRDESESFKVLPGHAKMEQGLPPQLMKSLDTKFQIPKLSARNNPVEGDGKKPVLDKNVNMPDSVIRPDISKPIDLVNKADCSVSSSKFPIPKAADESKSIKLNPHIPPPSTILPLSTSNLKSSSPSLSSAATKPLDVAGSDIGISQASVTGAVANVDTLDLVEISRSKADNLRIHLGKDDVKLDTTGLKPLEPSQTKFCDESKKIDLSNKIPVSKLVPPPTTPQEAAEILLDFSTSKSLPPPVTERVLVPGRRNTPPPLPPPPAFPNSPSVSVHIVKSPAPSPRIIPSPHSVSPCITDDELMDEALVGMGK